MPLMGGGFGGMGSSGFGTSVPSSGLGNGFGMGGPLSAGPGPSIESF